MPTEKKLRVFKIEDSGTVEEYSIRDSHINLAYGVCSTAEATTAKIVTLTNDPGWELKPGSMISVKFLYPVSVASTLNVDETGAKDIWQHGAAAVNVIRANDTVQLVYDGTRYSILAIDSASQLRPGEAGGLATLDSSGKIPGSQLPSYVDDVLEFTNRDNFPVTGEAGKIYVDTSSNESYRWSGSTYIRIDNVDEFVGATSSSAGSAGLVPAPASGDQHKFLGANGQWNDLDASMDIDISIPVNGWSATAPYTYTWLNSNVTDGCSIKVYFLTGSEEDDTLFIEFEKISGGIRFTAPTLPTNSIPVRIHLIYFETGINDQQPMEADRISTDAIHGAANVEEALTTLNTNINTKLDKPVNVPADRFLRTDADGQAVWAAAASSSEVADAVSDWLSDNITTGQTIALDESLTVVGAAGDAKVTGDRLNAFTAEQEALSNEVSELKSAVNGKANAVISSASGAIASFSDGADDLPLKSLKVVGIEPVQDLHGYDHPWPAGGGKNVFYHEGNLTATANGLTATFDGTSQTVSITGTNTGTSAYILLNIACTGDIPRETPLAKALINAPSGIYANFAYRKNMTWVSVNNGDVIPADTDEGVAINFQIGILTSVTTLNATGLHIQIERGSTTPTAWTPYSNICPITGWTGAKVTRTGKNLSSVELLAPTAYWGGSYAVLVDLINLLPVGTYTLSHKATVLTLPDSGTVMHGPFYVTAMVNGSQVPVSSYRPTTDNSPSVGKVYEDSTIFTITETNKGKCNNVCPYCDSSVHTGTGRGNYQIYNIQLELGSTATTYEPYAGSTYSISFPSEAGTVYGGSLDVTSGVLTVDRAMVDLGTLSWQYYQNGIFFTVTLETVAKIKGACVSDIYVNRDFNISAPINGYMTMAANVDKSVFRVVNTAYSDKTTTFKTAMSGHQLVYELATPITYHLTPQEVRTLLGQNNIWADTGDIENVTYKADTKLYIDNKFTQIIDALNA